MVPVILLVIIRELTRGRCDLGPQGAPGKVVGGIPSTCLA